MMFDATKHSPAEPFLAEALKRSMAVTLEECMYLHGVMQDVHAKYGDLPYGTPISMGEGIPNLYYSAPEILQQDHDMMKGIGTILDHHITSAATAEQQEGELLCAMREMLEVTLMNGGKPQAVYTLLATIDGIFEEYKKADMPMSEVLEDMQHGFLFYGDMVRDALVASEALLARYQRHEGVPAGQMLRTPYALAFKKHALKSNPLRELDEAAQMKQDVDISNEAENIVDAMIKDYAVVLPFQPRLDMLGLVLRCSERLHVIELNKQRARHERVYNVANDNDVGASDSQATPSASVNDMPVNEAALFDDPLVRRHTHSLLKHVFLKHPNAGESPQAMMKAAASLEDALMAVERRAERPQGR